MLTNIIGQDKLKLFIMNEIQSGNLSYGYLIEGEQYMGKDFIAQEIAEELTSSNYIKRILPTDDRKLLSVNDIREMKDDAYSYSFKGETKVYIIPNADDMNASCQNAFLKLLEEPPQDCVFLLLVKNRMSLLETIRSRCVLLSLARYSDSEIKQYLQQHQVDFDNEIVRLCNGSLNRYLYLNSKEFEPIRALAFKIVCNLNVLHNARIFAILKHLKKMKEHINDVLDIFLIWYRDMYVYKITQDESLIEFTSHSSEIKAISKSYTEEQILKIIDKIEFTRMKMVYNCNFDMSIDTLLLYMKGVVE